jgi:glucosamine--fructose-6-phosphate aminotransferase (isomerizing)
MCGIMGCVVRERATEVLLEGLRRLEYRGYDSAGIAVLTRHGVEVRRQVGKLAALQEAIRGEDLDGTLGVGHTRWATHGKVSEENAHPHRDCTGNLVAIHNGIIENYLELKQDLLAKGHRFASETDTEVLVHLIEEMRKTAPDLGEAVRRALARVQGAWALVVMDQRSPDTLVGARQFNPLLVGLGQGEYFLASDVPAVLEHTRDVVYLEDGEVVEIDRKSGARITRVDGTPVPQKVAHIDWDLLKAEKGGYRHFMLKEIHEQPQVIADTLLGRLDEENGDFVLEDLGLRAEALRQVQRVVFLACGTSWHAGLYGAMLMEDLTGLPASAEIGSEYRYRNPAIVPGTLAVAISQSGETADTLGAAREARKRGAPLLAICNVRGSSLARDADGLLYTRAGPEIGVASTKAFTGQLLALALLAGHVGRVRGSVTPERGRALMQEARRLQRHLEQCLDGEEEIARIAQRWAGASEFLFLGRDYNFPVALEGALKLKEISYIHAEGYAAGEMKHGPIALIDERLPVVAVATKGRVYDKLLSNLEVVRTRGGRILAVAHPGDQRVRALADEILPVPETREDLAPIVNVVPLQLLAYHVALRRGCDVDQPRNLAKSVTVE